MQNGVVIKSTGSWYQVRRDGDDKTIICRIVGKHRLNNLLLTNPVAVGDRVQFVLEDDGNGMIRKISPRVNYVARQSPHNRMAMHLVAANIDQAILFTTVVFPTFKAGFIDRFLLMTEPRNIPTIIVFNKADLYDDIAMDNYLEIRNIYQKIGYTVLLVSAIHDQGLEPLKAILKDKVTLLSGQSGVGKSSVVNAMQPQLDLRTGDISDYSGKGQHTTTFAEMHPLSFGGSLIDTPGMKILGFNNLDKFDIAHNFREIFETSKQCRFGGSCLHREEPHCAVKAAVEKGEIAETRYGNYLVILGEAEEQKHWEKNKM
jgi:ribosome biogenesis GTPase